MPTAKQRKSAGIGEVSGRRGVPLVPKWSGPELDAGVARGPGGNVAYGGGEHRRAQHSGLADDGGRALGLARLEEAVGGGDPGEGLVAGEPSHEAHGGAEAMREAFEVVALGAVADDDEVGAGRMGEGDGAVDALSGDEAAADDPEALLGREGERAAEGDGLRADVGDLDGRGLDPRTGDDGLGELGGEVVTELVAQAFRNEAEARTPVEKRAQGRGSEEAGCLAKEADVAAVGDHLDLARLGEEAERQPAGEEEVQDRAVEAAAMKELASSLPEERGKRRGPQGPLTEAFEGSRPAEQNGSSEPYDVYVGARSPSAFARCQNQDLVPFSCEKRGFRRDEVAGGVALVAGKGSRQKDDP